MADRPQDRRRVRPARRRDGAGDAAGRPDLELVACGSSSARDADVRRVGARPCSSATLRRRRLHLGARLLRGARRRPRQLPRLGASTWTTSSTTVVATADHVRAPARHEQARSTSRSTSGTSGTRRAGSQDEPGTASWPVAPRLIEDVYTVADAVVVGNLLISLLRHADRVHGRLPGAAGQRDRADHDRARRAGLAADDLPPVRPDRPAARAATCCGSRSTPPMYETARYGEVPLVDAVATHDEEAGAVALFAVNRVADRADDARARPARAARPARRRAHDARRRRPGRGQHESGSRTV